MAGIAFLILFPFFLCTCIGIKKEKRACAQVYSVYILRNHCGS